MGGYGPVDLILGVPTSPQRLRDPISATLTPAWSATSTAAWQARIAENGTLDNRLAWGVGMNGIDYKRNAKYFSPVSYKGPVVIIVLGVLLIAARGIGLILIGIGGAWIYMQLNGRPSDGEIDDQLQAHLANVRQQAQKKLNLDDAEVALIEPVLIAGYNHGGGGKTKKGKDGRWRTSLGEAIVIFFDEHELHSYKYNFSLVEGGKTREATDEYFYRDVVSISTTTEQWRPASGEEETFEVFKMTTSGGTSVSCSMFDENNSNRSLQGARQLIKDKKRQP